MRLSLQRKHMKAWRLGSWGNPSEKDRSNQGHAPCRGQDQATRSSSPHAFLCPQRLLISVMLLEMSLLLGILQLNDFSLFSFSSLPSAWASILKPLESICQRNKQHCHSKGECGISLKNKNKKMYLRNSKKDLMESTYNHIIVGLYICFPMMWKKTFKVSFLLI